MSLQESRILNRIDTQIVTEIFETRLKVVPLYVDPIITYVGLIVR